MGNDGELQRKVDGVFDDSAGPATVARVTREANLIARNLACHGHHVCFGRAPLERDGKRVDRLGRLPPR